MRTHHRNRARGDQFSLFFSSTHRAVGRRVSGSLLAGLFGLLLAYRSAASAPATRVEPGSASSSISGTALSESGAGLRKVVITLEPLEASKEAGPIVKQGQIERVIMTNSGGRFVPDFLVVPVGTTVTFKSGDGLFHTAQLSRSGKWLTHLGLPGNGRETHHTFTAPGVITVKDWINPKRELVYIVITESRFFDISNGYGRFSITDVPAGIYTLRAWHKDLGSRTFKVTVAEAKETKVEFVLEGPRIAAAPRTRARVSQLITGQRTITLQRTTVGSVSR